VKLTITIGTHLSSSGARMQGLPSTAKSDVYSRKLRSLPPYLVNYVFSWCYSSAWRFNPSDVFRRPRTLWFASAYLTPYSLKSTDDHGYFLIRRGSKWGTVKLLEPTNLEALQFATREVEGSSMFEYRYDKSECKVNTHSKRRSVSEKGRSRANVFANQMNRKVQHVRLRG
jgi:hypothetical protein